ncbi:imidazole glycerol phosphate synthase subunit HisH [bacterium]|nr:imidazole glycerol phosphate synthase subunit HisH [bacterium]
MVGIINYGAGNIYSVLMGVKIFGKEAVVIETPEMVKKVEIIILPGVGAFEDGMRNLKERSISEAIVEEIERGKPFLGICLGFQLLFPRSEEGNSPGFNILKGKVKKFEFKKKEFRIPHMGWNKVKFIKEEKLFEKIPDETFFYFAHSYYPVPEDENIIAGITDYGVKFSSVVRKDNIVGVQFHPEKSGNYGLTFFKNFLEGKWLL